MISRCRAKCWIIQLKEDQGSSPSETTQRGIKGNIIIYPQKVSQVASVLPPNLEELAAPICVVFVGSHRPSNEWLRKHAKPLAVRPGRVMKALVWLKCHNPLYRDIRINTDLLQSLPENYVLPVHVEHVQPNSALDSVTSESVSLSSAETDEPVVTFDKVVIMDVDGSATSSQMRAAAVRHVHNNGGFIQFPHDPEPVNEFMNPALFPMIYPTLFPYGMGGFENHRRSHRQAFSQPCRSTFSGAPLVHVHSV
ncbi:hypothetical protein F5878DRAFT_654672 [Lentinula raphanica]|uniref:DUF6570 domain-containing protein n=1 Tax=Lentinula raphanica TaxID=153919 RepID=A0AA38NX65_9AGAR|nr:hypothetical protein F5878DRAFT_654672 [Lentinula raphanica]